MNVHVVTSPDRCQRADVNVYKVLNRVLMRMKLPHDEQVDLVLTIAEAFELGVLLKDMAKHVK